MLQLTGCLAVFLPPYALSIGASTSAAFYMSTVLNAATFFGRFMLGQFADKCGPWNTIVLITFICGVLNFAWTAVNTNAGLWVWAALYGFFSGAIASIQGPCNLILCPQPNKHLLEWHLDWISRQEKSGFPANMPAGAFFPQKSPDFLPRCPQGLPELSQSSSRLSQSKK